MLRDKPFFYNHQHDLYILCGHKWPTYANAKHSDHIRALLAEPLQSGWYLFKIKYPEVLVLAHAPSYRLLKIKIKLLGINLPKMRKFYDT